MYDNHVFVLFMFLTKTLCAYKNLFWETHKFNTLIIKMVIIDPNSHEKLTESEIR